MTYIVYALAAVGALSIVVSFVALAVLSLNASNRSYDDDDEEHA